jgi:hypothetical protein
MVAPNFTLEPQEIAFASWNLTNAILSELVRKGILDGPDANFAAAMAAAMARGQGIEKAAQLIEIQIPTAKGVDVSAEAKKRGMKIDRNALK